MILVNGVQLALGHRDSSSPEGIDILNFLVRHPALRAASSSYKALPERTFSLCDKSDFLVTRETKWVYINQKEYATVDPYMVDVETGKGSIFPATFHVTTKGPDEYIRSIRERASLRDLNWKNRFLETYDTESDQFVIAHVSRGKRYLKYIESLRNQSDEELCNTYFTIPVPASPHNIRLIRSDLEELFQVPDWEKVFPFRRPRIFFRSNNGGWTMRTLEHVQIIKRTAGKR
ncbi:unnamed protein product [Cuscuta europaea]|uniref:Uncharacterized protein n=1 Tax=Cuscuta europaea TaxID=41803 RepID=A0A9P0ZDP1_CUSEU|nr:unnamed protein product [Cuscuta europaea]